MSLELPGIVGRGRSELMGLLVAEAVRRALSSGEPVLDPKGVLDWRGESASGEREGRSR